MVINKQEGKEKIMADKKIGMNLSQSGRMTQVRRLMMSSDVQQSLMLLQMPILKLQQVVECEMVQNPVLELEGEDSSEEPELETSSSEEEYEDLDFDQDHFETLLRLDEEFSNLHQEIKEKRETPLSPDATLAYSPSLYEQLMMQAVDHFNDSIELKIAQHIIGNLNEKGFLDESLDKVAQSARCHVRECKRILGEVQSFDPPGIGAMNVRECLLIQLKRKRQDNTLAYRIIQEYYEELLSNQIPMLARKLSCNVDDIQRSIREEVSSLNLQPSSDIFDDQHSEVIPDIVVHENEGDLTVEVTGGVRSNIRFNSKYLRMYRKEGITDELKNFLENKIKNGQRLVKGLNKRQSTLHRIGEFLIQHHRKFFISNLGSLQPLTMRFVAEQLRLHESTIARAVMHKYLFCSRGLYPLKFFFTGKYETDHGKIISAYAVKKELKRVVAKEDKAKPLSDQKISEMLKEKGISCARRTVAKYRDQLSIPPARYRKNWDQKIKTQS